MVETVADCVIGAITWPTRVSTDAVEPTHGQLAAAARGVPGEAAALARVPAVTATAVNRALVRTG